MPFGFFKSLEGAPIIFCLVNEFAKVIPRSLTIIESPSTTILESSNIDSSSCKGKKKVDDVNIYYSEEGYFC